MLKNEKHSSVYNKLLNSPYMIHTSEHETQELDLSEIIKLAGDDANFLHDLIKLYIEQFGLLYTETLEGLKQKNQEELRRIFHKMKPSVMLLKQNKMKQLMDQAHSLLHYENPDFGRISSLTLDYLSEMEKLQKLLQKQLENKN